MKIVINALPYKKNSSGIGVLIRDLFGTYAVRTQYPCQVLLSSDAPEFPSSTSTEHIRMPFKREQELKRILFQSVGFGRKYCKDAILLTTDSKMPFFLPRSCIAVTLISDMAVFRLPQTYQLSRVLLWRLQYLYVRRRANVFLAISEFTKSEISSLLKISPKQIYVLPCAASTGFTQANEPHIPVQEKYHLPENFLLFVGNFNPRKNLERTIKAFDLAKEMAGFPHQLVIAGEQGWKFDREKSLQGLRHPEDIRFIGFVADADMSALYSAADLFLFPTLYEGFGIPVVEAQSCGTPVLTSNCSALPETGGEGAWYVDPCQVDDICDGILRILQDAQLRKQLIDKGYQNAAHFSWENTAKHLQEIIEEEGEFMKDREAGNRED